MKSSGEGRRQASGSTSSPCRHYDKDRIVADPRPARPDDAFEIARLRSELILAEPWTHPGSPHAGTSSPPDCTPEATPGPTSSTPPTEDSPAAPSPFSSHCSPPPSTPRAWPRASTRWPPNPLTGAADTPRPLSPHCSNTWNSTASPATSALVRRARFPARPRAHAYDPLPPRTRREHRMRHGPGPGGIAAGYLDIQVVLGCWPSQKAAMEHCPTSPARPPRPHRSRPRVGDP